MLLEGELVAEGAVAVITGAHDDEGGGIQQLENLPLYLCSHLDSTRFIS